MSTLLESSVIGADPARALARRHAIVLGTALLLWFVVWMALPLRPGEAVPGDNLEQLDWAAHPAWGYAKHPPFPTWILWCFERVFMPGVALTYFLGALQVAFLLWMAWLLARDTLGDVVSWIAPLMVACITYHSIRMHYYNHNTALMTAYAGSLLALWRAITTRRTRWWLLLGLTWGVGMLSKYQMGLLIGCNVVFLWSVRHQGAKQLLGGFGLACAVASCIVAPHLLWLVQNHFPSFDYASIMLAAHLNTVDRVQAVVNFWLHQAGRLVPLVVLLAVLAWRVNRSPAQADGSPDESTLDELARGFWRIHAWGPIAGITLLGLLFGVAVENHWGMASLWAIPFWILTTARGRRWATAPAGEVWWAASTIQALVVVVYVAKAVYL